MKRLSVACLFVAVTFITSCVNSTAFAYDSLKMLNSTGKTIYFVYLTPKGQGWGSDRLKGVWDTGETLTLKVPNYRYWALKIEFEDDSVYYWAKEKCIDTQNIYSLTIALNNQGGYTLYYNK